MLHLRTLARRTWLMCALAVAICGPAAAADERPLYPKQYTVSPKGVNIQTGRFMASATDLTIGDLSFTRMWGDQPFFNPTRQHMLGALIEGSTLSTGWRHATSQGVFARSGGSGETRLQVIVDDQQYQFYVLSGGGYGPIDRASNGTYLRKIGNLFRFTDKTGAIFDFVLNSAVTQPGFAGLTQVLATKTAADGTIWAYSYRATGQVQEVRSTRGYALRLDYDANNNVSKVCGYNLATTEISPGAACQAAAIAATYGYDATGTNLTSVTLPGNETTTISYVSIIGGGYAPACITLANSATCAITNTYVGNNPPPECQFARPDQVIRQVTATGKVWTYCYTPEPDPRDQPYVVGRPRFSEAVMNGPEGTSSTFRYDRGRLIDYRSPDGPINYKYRNAVVTAPYATTTITFEFMDTAPVFVTLASGVVEYYVFDARNNVLLLSKWPKGSPDPMYESGEPGLSTDPDLRSCCLFISANDSPMVLPAGAATVGEAYLPSFGSPFVIGCGNGEVDAKLCDKPTLRIDERGFRTDFEYSQVHGGILKETGPAVNGVRPETRYVYDQRRARLKSGSGHAPAPPIWVLVAKSICKTGRALGTGCETAGDEVRTTYDYGPDVGPNNLLLRAQTEDATGLALRTCYTYDTRGNRISETKPRGTVAGCP